MNATHRMRQRRLRRFRSNKILYSCRICRICLTVLSKCNYAFLQLMVGHDRSKTLKQDPTRAGWSSEINQLLIGEVLSDEFDGKILNPHDVEIDLPFWVFKRLKKLHLLERDPSTGMRRIQVRVFGLMDVGDGPDFRPDRRFRTFDPGYQRARSKDSGYASAFIKASSRDSSQFLVNRRSPLRLVVGRRVTRPVRSDTVRSCRRLT